MKPLPPDQLDLRARVLNALCEDLFDLGAGRARSFERTNALRAVLRQQRRHSADEKSIYRKSLCASALRRVNPS